MALEDQLAVVDELLAFPGSSGFHVRVLQASQDFWDDRSTEIVVAAANEIDAAFQALATALTSRWGEPEAIDLTPYLWSEDAVAEPIDQLCQYCGEMLVWPSP